MPLRAAIVYGALLVMVRISGRRTVGQFTPFDLLVVLLLSESVSGALTGGAETVSGGLLSAFTLIGLNMLVALATSRSKYLQTLVEGHPILVGRDGQVYTEVLKKNRVPFCDFQQALREADCDLKDMRFSFLETDGRISVLKDSSGK
ncbi:MAG: DUF421 domain-containing protein [Burkholderiales bacterium]|nr:MAG: DUF421 domain-containing protein [Burkholderiales bacterium]